MKKKNLPGRGLTKIEKHWSYAFISATYSHTKGHLQATLLFKKKSKRIIYNCITVINLDVNYYIFAAFVIIEAAINDNNATAYNLCI